MTRDKDAVRGDYRHFLTIPTRWMDNDVYGHVNNVVYYSYFDTVVNEYLVREAGLDIEHASVVAVVVETQCRYHRELAFPDVVEAGLRIAKLGRSSARYEIGIFKALEDAVCATGHFVHLYVDRQAMTPVPIPGDVRAVLAKLAV